MFINKFRQARAPNTQKTADTRANPAPPEDTAGPAEPRAGKLTTKAWAALRAPLKRALSAKPEDKPFQAPLPEGTKPPGTYYAIAVGTQSIARRVALLGGGAHGNYYVAQMARGAHGSFGKLRIGLNAQGKPVAVKVLRLEDKEDARTHASRLQDIVAELNAASQAGPEYRALDVVQVGKKVFIVMPLAGGDLHDLRHSLWRSFRTPTEAQTKEMAQHASQVARHALTQTAPALKRLHQAGWMHLDLKLENLLWFPSGDVRLGDFGLASDGKKPVNLRGTLHTMAPEVAAQLGCDGRADVWSLGVTLCEMLDPGHSVFTSHINGSAELVRDSTLTRVQMNHIVFDTWRHALPRAGNGDLNLTKLHDAAGRDPMKKLFADHLTRVCQADPELCQFILKRMLAPLARDRATMEEVLHFAGGLPESRPPQRAKLADLLRAHAPRSKTREGTLKLLREVAADRAKTIDV